MKKFLAVAMILVLTISMAACSRIREDLKAMYYGYVEEETTAPTEATEADTTAVQETTAPATTAPATTAPTMAPDGIRYYSTDSYLFTVTNPDRVIFDAPDGNYVRVFDEIGVYTIVQEAVDAQGVKWGKLKSGVGWVRFDDNVLPNLNMFFSSGVGAWGTQLEIYEDGTFSGVYSDTDMGDSGAGYPHGTVYYSEFSGKFTDVTIIDAYTLDLTLEYLYTSTPTGQTEYTNNQRYIYTDPYGLDGGYSFRLYLPLKSTSYLPQDLLSWCSSAVSTYKTKTDRYILHNLANDQGFAESVY